MIMKPINAKGSFWWQWLRCTGRHSLLATCLTSSKISQTRYGGPLSATNVLNDIESKTLVVKSSSTRFRWPRKFACIPPDNKQSDWINKRLSCINGTDNASLSTEYLNIKLTFVYMTLYNDSLYNFHVPFKNNVHCQRMYKKSQVKRSVTS